jgi:hypothetical protein
MPKLFIANCSKQFVDFAYRIAEEASVRLQRISIGGQIAIAGDLNTLQIDYIIKQHLKYGLIPEEEVKNAKGFVGLAYQIGKPLSVTTIMHAMSKNKAVLIKRGKDMRQNVAVAANNIIEDQLAENELANLDKLEVTIEEVDNPRGSQTEDSVGSADEAIRVTRSEIPDAPRGERTRQRRGGKGKRAA